MIHRGKILESVLRKWCDENGAALSYIAKKAGYDRSSTYRHFKEEDLDYSIIRQYGSVIRHDFSQELPEIKEAYSLGLDPERPYPGMTIDEAMKQIEHWRGKYIDLLEQYNTVVVKELLLKNENN